MVNLRPTECNICGGKVVYCSNDKVYGKKYGSGYCYLCLICGAYVGTHIPNPRYAFGLLADEKMRKMKIACHSYFDKLWTDKKTNKEKRQERRKSYKWLANQMGIAMSECHFGFFNYEQLVKAYGILKEALCKNL